MYLNLNLSYARKKNRIEKYHFFVRTVEFYTMGLIKNQILMQKWSLNGRFLKYCTYTFI